MEKYCPECGTLYPSDQDRCDRDGRRLLTVVSDDLWVGRELDGRYHVLRLLGKGGMGTVFEVEQSLLGRRLALKLLRRELGQDKASVMRFFAEAKAMASLRNAHTITLHDFGATEEGQLFYTMDLLDGKGLHELMKETGPMPFGRACAILLQVLESLEEAHDRNILHRDLKPENMFIAQVKGRDFAVVLDFGIAKMVGDSAQESVTRTGLICGTPAYMSPEQALGTPAVKASDLYSLGVVLYEMLAGALPFPGGTPLRQAMSHISEIPAALSTREGLKVPEPLERFLCKALEKDPIERYGTVAEFRAALLSALMQSPRPAAGVMASASSADLSPLPSSGAELFAPGGVFGPSSSEWSASSWAGASGETPVTALSTESPVMVRRFPWLPVLASAAFLAVASAAVWWGLERYRAASDVASQAEAPEEGAKVSAVTGEGSSLELTTETRPDLTAPRMGGGGKAADRQGKDEAEVAPSDGSPAGESLSGDTVCSAQGGGRCDANRTPVRISDALMERAEQLEKTLSLAQREWNAVWMLAGQPTISSSSEGADRQSGRAGGALVAASRGKSGLSSGRKEPIQPATPAAAGAVTGPEGGSAAPKGEDDLEEIDFRPVVVPPAPKIHPGLQGDKSRNPDSTSHEGSK